MIKEVAFFISLGLSLTFLLPITEKQSTAPDDSKEICLREQEKGTRGITITSVTAFIVDEAVTVTIMNYTGKVTTLISGSGGVQQQSANITNDGQCVVDISILPEGSYYIRVVLENTIYEGYFEY